MESRKSVLIVTGIEGARNLAPVVQEALGMDVQLAEGRRTALAALRKADFEAVVLDETLAECDLPGAEAIWEHARLAIPLQINFALSGGARLIREIRAALQRREREQAIARKAAESAVQLEIRTALSGLLLQSQLALSASDVPAPVAEKLRVMTELANHLRQQLSLSVAEPSR